MLHLPLDEKNCFSRRLTTRLHGGDIWIFQGVPVSDGGKKWMKTRRRTQGITRRDLSDTGICPWDFFSSAMLGFRYVFNVNCDLEADAEPSAITVRYLRFEISLLSLEIARQWIMMLGNVRFRFSVDLSVFLSFFLTPVHDFVSVFSGANRTFGFPNNDQFTFWVQVLSWAGVTEGNRLFSQTFAACKKSCLPGRH